MVKRWLVTTLLGASLGAGILPANKTDAEPRRVIPVTSQGVAVYQPPTESKQSAPARAPTVMSTGIAVYIKPVKPPVVDPPAAITAAPPAKLCQAPMYLLAGECVCPAGRIRDGNSCATEIVVQIAPPTLPGGIQGDAYPQQTLVATGGIAPYQFARLSGGLPPGMTFSSTGALTGTPAATGAYTVTVAARDAKGNSAVQDYVLIITAPRCPAGMYRYGGECVCPAGYSRDGNSCREIVTMAIVPPTLPGGTQGEQYPDLRLTASGGTAPYQFEASGLSPGLTLTADGVLNGIPGTAGSYRVTALARDIKGETTSLNYTLVIAAPRCPSGMYRVGSDCACPAGLTKEGNTCSRVVAVSITPPTLPGGKQGEPYPHQALKANGGMGPYRFASGALPPGLVLTTDGVLSGTPSTAGSFGFAAIVMDAKGSSAAQDYILIITAPAVVALTCPSGTKQFGINCLADEAPAVASRPTPIPVAVAPQPSCPGDLKRIKGECQCQDRNQVQQGYRCVDRPKTVAKQPDRADCPGDLERVRGNCVCSDSSQIQQGYKCVDRPKTVAKQPEREDCPGDLERVRGRCVCSDSDQIQQGNRCVDRPRTVHKQPEREDCPGDLERVGGRCVCTGGTYQQGNRCVSQAKVVEKPNKPNRDEENVKAAIQFGVLLAKKIQEEKYNRRYPGGVER